MREDPTGKRALFSTQAHSRPNATGKRALFSDRWTLGTPISAECSTCGRVTEVEIGEALRRFLRFGLVVPTREYPVRMRCPACGRRSWVKLRPS